MNRFDNPDIYVELDHTSRRNRRKKRKVVAAIAMAGSILLLLLVCLGTGFYIWMEEQKADNTVITVTGDEVTESASYTKKELDHMLEEAMTNGWMDGMSQGREEVLEQIKASLDSGISVNGTLRRLYADDIIVVSGGKYHFVPINRELKLNNYVQENLVELENGQMQYVQDGQVTSYKGIDVSSHQGKVDWKKVAADGVSFAFIRAGYRGYGTGKLVDDEYFDTNMKNAIANGVKVGAYVFSQAITVEEAKEEAEFILEMVKPYKVDLPIVFDVEKVSASDGRMNLISVEERTKITIAFCETIKAAGYRPMVYHNLETGAILVDIEQLEEYDKWFAYYSNEFYYPYAYDVWQYSDTGRVNGIQGNVDLNIAFVPLWE